MKKYLWINRVCELEKEGRFDEAHEHYVANTSPEERASFAKGRESIVRAIASITPEAMAETEEIMKRVRARDDWPEGHPKRIIWERMLDTTPGWAAPIWRHLPDSTVRPPGRPVGPSKVTEEVLDEMDRRMAADEKPTRAAKAIIGDIAGVKNAADYIVKQWRKRGKNSG